MDENTPRLGIVHLFAWTAASAVWMALERLFYSALGNQSPSTVLTVSSSLAAPVQGAGLMGFLLFVYRRLRGRPCAREPGDWLLVAYGAAILMTLIEHLLIMSIIQQPRPLQRQMVLMAVSRLSFSITQIALYAVAARRIGKSPLWRGVLWLLCWLQVARMVMEFVLPLVVFQPRTLLFLRFFPDAAAGVVVSLSAIADGRRRHLRSWTHWTGVAVVVVDGVLALSGIAWWLVTKLP
ncbi:MAG TPA: hypothetical protein VJ783_31185 [Pirellulales bacterium]|nr:hypothetical protein [Pirellulales bacterium]